MSDSRPTLDQRRAQHAWKAVERTRSLRSKDDQETFAREAKRLPVRIKTSGLGQALAFLAAKSKSDLLLVALGDWLLQERRLVPPPNPVDKYSLIQKIINGDANLLRRATEEALLYLQWLTRFSEAELGTGDD